MALGLPHYQRYLRSSPFWSNRFDGTVQQNPAAGKCWQHVEVSFFSRINNTNIIFGFMLGTEYSNNKPPIFDGLYQPFMVLKHVSCLATSNPYDAPWDQSRVTRWTNSHLARVFKAFATGGLDLLQSMATRQVNG